MTLDDDGRLTSWKTIAAYLQCNERTVKRWEQQRALPVHRLPGAKRGIVFAYRHELDAWLHAEKLREDHTAERPAPDNSRVVPERLRAPRRWFRLGAFTATAVLGTVAIFLFRAERPRLRSTHLPAPGAQELYIRGRYLWNLRTAASLGQALDAFQQAIAKDPDYAEAYSALAETYNLLPEFGQTEVGASLTKAIDAADRAIQLNPDLADAHRAKAFAAFFWNWDIAGSDAEFRKSLRLDPNSAQTHHWYASSLERRLEGVECLRQIKEALRLDPTSAAIAADAALFRADFEDFAAGVRGLKEIERTQPTLLSPVLFLRELDFAKGDYPAYIDDVRRVASMTKSSDDAALADAISAGWAKSGRTGLLEARAATLKQAFAHGSEEGFKLGQTLLL